MDRFRYGARCERDGRAWTVDVPELRIHTFGATLADAEEMARDAIALVLDAPVERVSVALEVVGTPGAPHGSAGAGKAGGEAEQRPHRAR
ncbi:type II toxin-antitoxin system HicB family antitoxin [Nocardiopsis sp. CNT-189]|uniref:type II toxin-antitoxin system HicB family antitoxin n=1 Tax=Nocardiopsis oceanisediminis TaxID=2816862 RepID=UPI003B38BF25